MEVDAIIQETVKILKKHLPPDTKVLLFGSWAKGNATPTSDIDIGVLGTGKASFQMMTIINEEVERIPTLRSIDVVDLGAMSDLRRKTILKYARPL